MTSSRIKLILGTINTFPGGLSAEEVEDLYQGYLVPVLKALYNRRKIHVTFYFSGSMLEWLSGNHSEYISAFSEMLQQRRVEVLGGGYWDPIFPIIPRLDRLGQLEHLTNRVRQTFTRKPRGAWLTNFFWEPDMASVLHSAGMEYTFLDDSFFKRAGIEDKDLFHPAITEDQGKTLTVLPVSGQGRRMFWKSSPEALLNHILAQGTPSGDRVFSLMYDCSLFGRDAAGESEPRLAWLNQFLDLVEEAQEKRLLETLTPAKLLKRGVFMTRAYFEPPTLEEVHAAAVGHELPDASWPVPQVLLPGINRLGYFAQKNVRHSLARYPEANLLYAKMQYVHSLTLQVKGDKYRKQAARESLWQAQNHAAYWHGPDGGLYINEYRKAAYSYLIEAEKSAREKGVFAPGIISVDFDFDGVEEFLYQGNDMNCYVHVHGGMIFEWDVLSNHWNYADTCARHPEMYHLAAQESEGYDTYPRRLFLDHFFEPSIRLDTLQRSEHEEAGSFIHGIYSLEGIKRESMEITLSHEGQVCYGDACVPLHLVKTFQFTKQTLKVTWTFTHQGPEVLETIFSPEVNLGFSSNDIRDLRLFFKESRVRSHELTTDTREVPSAQDLVFHDLARRTYLELSWDRPTACWSYPLHTHVKTSEGFIRQYQGQCVMPQIPLRLESGESQSLVMELGYGRINPRSL